MKFKILIVSALFSSTVFAAEGPEIIDLPATMGNITFFHHKHQEKLKDCSICHEQIPGKINELGKEWAHKTCKGCHYKSKDGPTACKDCHKR
jgi:hypothetical protein